MKPKGRKINEKVGGMINIKNLAKVVLFAVVKKELSKKKKLIK